MKLATLFRAKSLQAVLALPLALALLPSDAKAQAKAAPQAIALLDICHNEITGKWRYSGVVSVFTGAKHGELAVSIDSRLQNKTSQAGYFDAYKVDSVLDHTQTTATLAKFDVEAAPLSLGTVRSNVRVSIFDPARPSSSPITLLASDDFQAAVCGCTQMKGCVRTQGYWSNKPGVIWRSPYSRNATFFSSGLTWQKIQDTPSRGGNAYVLLAHQYVAAVLNRASGASAPSAVLP